MHCGDRVDVLATGDRRRDRGRVPQQRVLIPEAMCLEPSDPRYDLGDRVVALVGAWRNERSCPRPIPPRAMNPCARSPDGSMSVHRRHSSLPLGTPKAASLSLQKTRHLTARQGAASLGISDPALRKVTVGVRPLADEGLPLACQVSGECQGGAAKHYSACRYPK